MKNLQEKANNQETITWKDIEHLIEKIDFAMDNDCLSESGIGMRGVINLENDERIIIDLELKDDEEPDNSDIYCEDRLLRPLEVG